MRRLYWVAPEQLPDLVVEDIIKISSEYEEIIGGVGGSVTDNKDAFVDKEVRKARQRWIPPNSDNTKKIYNLCTEIFHEANRRCFSVDIQRIFNMFYAEYRADEGGFYGKHRDSFVGTDEIWDRKLSMTIQLSDSDEYEGGDFVFYDDMLGCPPDKDQIRKKGTVFVFPSFLLHGVKPVTKGTRKCFIAFIEGPTWK